MSTPPEFEAGDGLLLGDPQNDFCPGGALPVIDGDAVMPVLNEWAAAAERARIPVFVSRDWHPPKTTHFKDYGGVWPAHCVIGSAGAESHASLRIPASATVMSKGMGEREDAYSAFQARDDAGALLQQLLDKRGVKRLYVGGLATDYCVRSSALDALTHGYGVTLISDGMKAVNVQPGDSDKALIEMARAGATKWE